jgi:hypothetical protein
MNIEEIDGNIVNFVSLNKINLYGIYNPDIATLRDILAEFNKNYECNLKDISIYSEELEKYIEELDQETFMKDFKFSKHTVFTLKQVQVRQKSIDNKLYEEQYITRLYELNNIDRCMNISCKTLDGKNYDLKILPNFTILDLKILIMDMTKISPIYQRFIFNGKILENKLTVASYNLVDNSTIHMITKLSDDMIRLYELQNMDRTINVFCKTLYGKTIELYVNSDFTINDLKVLIMDVEGIPPCQQKIMFNGQILANDKTLSYYDIKNNSTFHIMLTLKGGMYHETSGKNGGFNILKSNIFVIE